MAWIDSKGYRTRLVDGREIREHRLVVERLLGRPLRPDEEVHHRNEDKLDNRPENLRVVSPSRHVQIHWEQGSYAARVERQTKPEATCSRCGWFGRLRARGMCKRCYHRDYYQRHPEKWGKVR